MSSNQRDIVGVILAGGRGIRMEPVSHGSPKPLLPICNQPLMMYHLDIMRSVGIREVFVVIGHLGHKIRQQVGSGENLGLRITYVEQKELLGIAHALGRLQPYVRSGFLLLLADIFFRPCGLERLVAQFRSQSRGSYVVARDDTFEALRKNFAVLFDPTTGRVRQVIEKPRCDPGSGRLKGCGQYLFDVPVFDAIRRTPRSPLRNEYEITDALQILIDAGEPVTVAEVVEEDVNLSTPHDLLRCNLMELDRRGGDRILGRGAVLAAEAHVRRSILGDGVRIEGSVRLENCLVFPEVTLRGSPLSLRNHILTQEALFDCETPEGHAPDPP